jgi:hypothetical protein
MGHFTFGIRVHHGYAGVMLAGIALWPLGSQPGLRNALLILSVALFASDILHHFAVLWLLTGSPEFDLFYPSEGRRYRPRSDHPPKHDSPPAEFGRQESSRPVEDEVTARNTESDPI